MALPPVPRNRLGCENSENILSCLPLERPGETGSKAQVYPVLLKRAGSQLPAGLRDSCTLSPEPAPAPACPACYPSSQWHLLFLGQHSSALALSQLTSIPVASWRGDFSGIQTRYGGLCSPSASGVVRSTSFGVNRPEHLLFSQAINLAGPQFPHLKMG